MLELDKKYPKKNQKRKVQMLILLQQKRDKTEQWHQFTMELKFFMNSQYCRYICEVSQKFCFVINFKCFATS